MGKLDKRPTWQLAKVRNKNEVIAETRNEGRKVHFASLMDPRCWSHSFKNTKVELYSETIL